MSDLLFGFHELPHQSRNLICFGVKREVSRFEYVDVRLWYIPGGSVPARQIERKVVLAPKDQKLWLRLL